MKKGTLKLSRKEQRKTVLSKIVSSQNSLSEFGRGLPELERAAEQFESNPSYATIDGFIKCLLTVQAARIIYPSSEKVEFLKSAFIENIRFSLLEFMISPSFVSAWETLPAKESVPFKSALTALYIWPLSNPWCTYSLIFGLDCCDCPHFIVSDSPQKLSRMTRKSACWTHNGYWSAFGKTIHSPKCTKDTFDTVCKMYLDFSVPLEYRKEAENA